MAAGMSRDTGKPLGPLDHLRQSILDILRTPVGTRVHRRDYGSRLPRLVDRPMNPALTADLIEATAEALQRWEPRIKVLRVNIAAATTGHVEIDLLALLIIDNTPLQFNGLVIP